MKDLLEQVYQGIYRRWHYSETRWRLVSNRAEAAQQMMRPLPFHAPLGRRLLSDLQRDGIARLHIDELPGGADLFREIATEEDDGRARHAAEIASAREVLARGQREKFKDFVVTWAAGEGRPTYRHASARLALQPDLLAVVNAYLGLYAELRLLEFWYTVAVERQPAVASQLWHRDYNDIALVKMFLYFDDVDEGSGPLEFVKGTHRGKFRRRDPRSVVTTETIRADDASMSALVPEKHWTKGLGRKGMMILAATKGYHKGGLATTRDRRHLMAGYYSKCCVDSSIPDGVLEVPIDAHPAVRFAAQGVKNRVSCLG